MDINSLMRQLKCRLLSETAIPSNYLLIPEIEAVVFEYNWYIGHSNIPGWTKLIRSISYSS